jgi:2,3,4,5-tetrahydropyridine-2,6-dicarboxylate N-succinyltransferase
MILEQIIDRLYAFPPAQLNRAEAMEAVSQLKGLLNEGRVRAAECHNNKWVTNTWVKKGIVLAFRAGELQPIAEGTPFVFFDRDTMSLKHLTISNNVRVVPGGTAVRDGAFIGAGVVMMPPSYVNIGAYVDEQTMIDSHALVGSCAQIGKRVHLSAGAQIGGVLEPIGANPVIIEDDVLVGGNTGIYEGTIVRRKAVIGAGVVLTGSTPVYDLVREKIYRKSSAEPLEIPAGAVVIPGSRSMSAPFAVKHTLSVTTPLIVKYRDEKTDAGTLLEEALR